MKSIRLNVGIGSAGATHTHPFKQHKILRRLLTCASLTVLALSACSQLRPLPAPAQAPALATAQPTGAIARQPTAPPVLESPRRIELSQQVTALGSIAIDRDDNLLVSDSDADLIYKFDPTGRMLIKFGSHGSGDGQFQLWNAKHEANGGLIALDAEGNIFVTDLGNHRVQKFTDKGEFVTQWGKHGEADGEMNEPYGISTDAQGNVYVSDMLTKRVQKFDNDGKFIAVVAKPDAKSADEPPWLANTVDRNGNIYVGTFGGQLHKSDSSGKQIPTWGDNIKIVRAVFNLITDDDGNLYVSDARPRVVKMHAIGTLLGEFAMPNPEWPETAANATALDSKGQVYVGFSSWNGKVWEPTIYVYQLSDLKPLP